MFQTTNWAYLCPLQIIIKTLFQADLYHLGLAEVVSLAAFHHQHTEMRDMKLKIKIFEKQEMETP